MSASGLLVAQIESCEQCKLDSHSTSSKTFSLGDGVPVLLGHSSIASIIMNIGPRFRSFSMLLRHSLSAYSVGCCEPALCAEYSAERVSQ